jgi:hypothetical protein
VINNNNLEDKVIVLPSSHIGGHVYAPTLITYPSCNWYGRIDLDNNLEDINEILNSTLNNIVYEKCFRGNGNCENNIQW